MSDERRTFVLMRFLRSEAAGGVLLIFASLAALAWSNSAASPLYDRLLAWPVGPGGWPCPPTPSSMTG